MKAIRTTLFTRLLLGFCLANLLVLALGGYLARRFIDYTSAVDIDWTALAQQAEAAYEHGGAPALTAWSGQQRHDGIDATLFQQGKPLGPIRLGRRTREQLPDWLTNERNVVMQRGHGLTIAVQEVTGSDGQTRQLLALSRSRSRLPPQRRVQIFFAVQLGLALLFIGLVGGWLARSVAKPVAALRVATRRMAAGDLSTRVGARPGRTHDELAQLADDFDAMAERIEALVAHDRGVLQDLSHELRSPLARLQLILDLARSSADAAQANMYFQQAEDEVTRLDQLVGDMLALSRLEGGLPGDARDTIDAGDLLRGCVARARLAADARKIALQLAPIAADLPISGHALLLERSVDNVLTNAIKFSPEGASIELALRSVGSGVELHIRDHGPGVPEAELPLLFRPFYRGSNAPRAEGHGLGLAFVQRVLKAHGGSVTLANAEGGGLDVHLQLPMVASTSGPSPRV